MQEKQQIYESVMIGSKQYGSRKKIVSNLIVLEKLFQGLYQHIKEIILQRSKILITRQHYLTVKISVGGLRLTKNQLTMTKQTNITFQTKAISYKLFGCHNANFQRL